jgi:hypothetical protein
VSGSFLPSALSGLQLWLDGADEATKTLNGANVSAWADKSGNGRNASQATPANQPANVSGGAPVAGINYAAGLRLMTLASALAFGTAATIVAVCTMQTAAAGYVWADGTSNDGFLSNHTAVGDFEWFNTGGGTNRQTFLNDPAAGRHRLIAMQSNGVSLVGRADDVQVFSIVPTIALSSIQFIGAANLSAASAYRGVLHELLVWDRVLSADEITQLETYLLRWL